MTWLRREVLILLALGGLAVRGEAQERPLSFGVLNQQSPALTAERWNPILHYVSTQSGVPLQLRMGKNVEQTDKMMKRGEFDFMFTNHNFQTEFDSVGYRVIARWGGEPIHGVIAVAEESPFKELKDLEGRPVAFPSQDAFVAYAVPMVALRRAGVEVKQVFAGNQEGALAQLKARRVDAAAVNSRFLRRYVEREKMRVRELFVSTGFPDLAVIVHPRVPAATVAKVRQAFLTMKDDARAAPILTRAQCPGFEPAEDKDYEGVRRIYRLIGQ